MPHLQRWEINNVILWILAQLNEQNYLLFHFICLKGSVFVHICIAHALLQNAKYLLLLNAGYSDRSLYYTSRSLLKFGTEHGQSSQGNIYHTGPTREEISETTKRG